jgi:hypothetical protein
MFNDDIAANENKGEEIIVITPRDEVLGHKLFICEKYAYFSYVRKLLDMRIKKCAKISHNG